MKHIFVVNPCAGKCDSGDKIAAGIDSAGVDAEIYCTTGPYDATRFVGEWIRAHVGEPVRFYACGGDGTLNEVVSGVVDGGTTDCVEVGCYPCGSGNDFVRNWNQGAPERYHDIASLCSAPSVAVDVLRVATADAIRYSINTLNFGFEAAVCRSMDSVRRYPLLGGKMAYITGIEYSLLRQRRHRCKVTVEGNPWFDGELMLLSMANGQWAGGGFHCAPHADPSDGLIEVMSVKTISIPRFARLIKYYKNGQIIEREELRAVVDYTRARRVTIEAGSHAVIAADGQVFYGDRFDIECLPNTLKFIVP